MKISKPTKVGYPATRRAIVAHAVKAMLFPKYRSDYFWGWRSAILSDEERGWRSVGDGDSNSIVSACVQWIARNFPEAPPALWQEDELGVRTRIRRTDDRARMLRVLRFPTVSPMMPRGFYSGVQLWEATLTSRVVDGNAYWIKIRDNRPFREGGSSSAAAGKGPVLQLWYVPHWMMEPRWPDDGRTFISHYEMNVNGEILSVPPQDVVHFRHGIDPDNIRKGRSPLHAVLKEIYSDEEAARFTAAVLKNMGFPGMIVSPATNNPWKGSDADVKTAKERLKDEFVGSLRGEPLVFSSPTNVETFGFSPQQLDLSALRDIPEERITAALGIPAAVAGFGAGLQQTKVGATMAELVDLAWQGCLIPTQRETAEDVATQLMPDFGIDRDDIEFGFDRSHVALFQDYMVKESEAWSRLFVAGAVKRSEVRSRFDLPSGPGDDVYMVPAGVVPTSANGRAGANGNQAPSDTPANQLPEAQPVA